MDLRRRRPQGHAFLPQPAYRWGIRCPVAQAPAPAALMTHKPPVVRYSPYADLSLSSGFSNIATGSVNRTAFARKRGPLASVPPEPAQGQDEAAETPGGQDGDLRPQ